MSIVTFIRENRTELETAINQAVNHVPRQASCYCHQSGTDHTHAPEGRLTAHEIRLWILNDEGLYSWARSEGVKV
jgi:hypothetical protein